MYSSECVKVGETDIGTVYIKRIRDYVQLKRYTMLDDDYMVDYIDSNSDLLSQWQDDAYHWRTEDSFDKWRQDYDYCYSDFFTYDSDTDEYYDEDDSDYMRDNFNPDNFESKEELIDRLMEYFNDEYNRWNLSWEEIRNEDELRNMAGLLYDNCIKYREEEEERRKPHWNVFNYYK